MLHKPSLSIGGVGRVVRYREAGLRRGMMQQLDLARKVHRGPSSFPPPKVTLQYFSMTQAFPTLKSPVFSIVCHEHHKLRWLPPA
jgi:hypothetical protein